MGVLRPVRATKAGTRPHRVVKKDLLRSTTQLVLLTTELVQLIGSLVRATLFTVHLMDRYYNLLALGTSTLVKSTIHLVWLTTEIVLLRRNLVRATLFTVHLFRGNAIYCSGLTRFPFSDTSSVVNHTSCVVNSTKVEVPRTNKL